MCQVKSLEMYLYLTQTIIKYLFSIQIRVINPKISVSSFVIIFDNSMLLLEHTHNMPIKMSFDYKYFTQTLFLVTKAKVPLIFIHNRNMGT